MASHVILDFKDSKCYNPEERRSSSNLAGLLIKTGRHSDKVERLELWLHPCLIGGERSGTSMGLLCEETTEQIIGAAFEVHRVLGYGFLEKVYQRSMQVELLQRGLKSEIEFSIPVRYKGNLVGDYRADLFVADCVIVEFKVSGGG